jgi:hypothetical protein
MKMKQCSETSAYKIQKPGNYPGESIQYSEHGERLKSRNLFCFSQQAPNRIWIAKVDTDNISVYTIAGSLEEIL